MTVFEMELSRVESNQYYYLTNDYSYPVLTTYADDQNNILFTEYYSTQVVNTTMDLATLTKKDDIKIYPNPFTDEVYIEINESAIVSVFSTTGKLVKKERINSIENRIDLYNLLPGMYFISIQADKGQNLFIEKVIKTR